MNRKSILAIPIFLLLLLACQKAIVKPESSVLPDTSTLTLASFNLQVFGPTKADKPEVMSVLAWILLQEIRDAEGPPSRGWTRRWMPWRERRGRAWPRAGTTST